MTIAITGASGALGRATAELLLAAVDPREVVLTTRDPGSLADLAARGAAVRHADFSDARTLVSAFAGVDKLLLVSTNGGPARLAVQQAAVAAAADAGVRHLVYTSFPEPEPGNPATVVPDHAGTERAVRSSGMAWTMLRNNLYSHMQVPALQHAAAAGRLVTNAGEGAVAYVSREDCAAAAVAVLSQDGHEGKAYDITGPHALRSTDLVALARQIAGRDVELVRVDDDEFAAGLRAARLPEPVVLMLTSFGAAARSGFLSTVSPAVQDLTGRPPAALAATVEAVPATS